MSSPSPVSAHERSQTQQTVVAGRPASSPASVSEPPKRLGVGVIGAGRWATTMHLPVLSGLDAAAVEVKAVCDSNQAAAERFAGRLGGRVDCHSGIDAMLSAHALDCVVILVPPASMLPTIEAVARRGLKFLCEKPPAPDVPGHQRLMELVGGLPHIVGYNRRFSPYISRAREWIATGGRLQSVTGLFSQVNRREENFEATMVHVIDTLRYLAGGDLARMTLETDLANGAQNYFLSGWTKTGTHVSMEVTPATASSQETYVMRGDGRSAIVAFPQQAMVDRPGYVDLHENNRLAARLGPAELGIAPHELHRMGGIEAEHLALHRIARGGDCPTSTLATSLQNIEIVDRLKRVTERRTPYSFGLA